MKKRILILCGCFLSLATASFAQTTTASGKSGVILKAGWNLANISINDDGGTNDSKSLNSFHVGLLGDFEVLPFLAIQPGLLFTGKGAKSEIGDPDDVFYSKATTNPMYLEVPVNVVFKTPPAPARFFIGAGPYIAMGIAGKNKVETKFGGATSTSEESIEWSNDDPTTADEEDAGYGRLRRFDYGLNGIVGVEASNLVISAGYGLGLAKLQSGSNSDENNNNKHRVFSLSLGIKF